VVLGVGDSKLISLRIPADVLEAVDAAAESERRSRAQVIVNRLRQALLAGIGAQAGPVGFQGVKSVEPSAVEVVRGPMRSYAPQRKLAESVAESIPGVIMANALTDRPPHDPSTCRTYKCGMCEVLRGVKS
jgi:hypothetical protein